MTIKDRYDSLQEIKARVYYLKRDVIQVEGSDSELFLQGQLSQDVTKIPEGGSAWSFLLNPDGKTSAWLRVSRTGDNHFLLDVDKGFGGKSLERLNRFKLRVNCSLALEEWHWVAIRGSEAKKYRLPSNDKFISVNASWPLIEGLDLISQSFFALTNLTENEEEEYQALRILNGIPEMGKEISDKTIPAATGLVNRSVSFTKGCYTGQELVARMDSRGNNVPRNLRIVHSDRTINELDEIRVNGEAVGTVSSSVSDDRGSIGLAYISRKIEPPTTGDTEGNRVHIDLLP